MKSSLHAHRRAAVPAILSVLLILSPMQPLRAQPSMPTPHQKPAELIGPTELIPGATLEFRFATAIVTPDSLGPATESPIHFDPELPGSFVWLSTRSGVFLPGEQLSLGRQWRAELRDGLKDAEGRPVQMPGGAAVATVATPPFRVTQMQTGIWSKDDVPPNVEPRMAFNAAVSLNSVHAVFRAADGRSVPARVRFATANDYFPRRPEEDLWLPETPAQSSEPGKPEELQNRLIFQPATPLDATVGWRLELAEPVRSRDGNLPAEMPLVLGLGTVQPLRLDAVQTDHLVLSGPGVTLEFNLPLAPDITEETAAEFFQFDPEPENLRWTVDWNGITARGNFPVGKPVKVRIGDGVVAQDGRTFSGARERTFTIGHIPPRLYLPTVTGQQLRYGRREFPVRWVNLAGLEFEVVRVPPADLPAARQAMKSYFKAEWDDEEPEELYRPVPMDAIRGERLKLPEIPLPPTAVDQRAEISLPWNKIVGDHEPGAFFLSVQGKPLAEVGGKAAGAQALIQLTDIGIFWKQDRSGLHVLTFSLQTGEPLSGVGLSLWDENLARFTTTTTNAEGRAFMPLNATPTWLFAQLGRDTEILPMGTHAETLPIWNFRTPVSYGPWVSGEAADVGWRGMIFTDRPLYQPGETVHVRGFLRSIAGENLSLPEETEVRVAVFSPGGDEVASQLVKTGALGDFAAEFEAPLSPRGQYRVAFQPGSSQFSWWQSTSETSITVADYQPDAFEVSASIGSPQPDGTAIATIKANYFAGGSVGPAKVQWVLQTGPASFAPQGFPGFQFLAFSQERTGFATASGTAEIAGNSGSTEFALPATQPSRFPIEQILTADVTDLNQQTVSTQTTRRIESSDFYLGIAREREELLRVGDSVRFRTVAVGPDGSPITEPVAFRAELLWRKSNVLRTLGAGNAVSFRTTIEEVPVAAKEATTVLPRRNGEEWRVDDLPALEFALPHSGSYLLRVSSKDTAGRDVVSEIMLYAAGQDETVWEYKNPYEIELVPERGTWAPGETARILIKNPLPGPAVVFIERGQKILRSWHVNLDGNAPILEVPLTDADAPNVYVSVALLRGAAQSRRKFPVPEFRHGLCMLQVRNPRDVLDVQVATEAPSAEPGQKIRAVVNVRDSAGTPVAGAGVTLWAVDDGILALTGYERPDALNVFGAPLPLGVRTGISLVSLIPENPQDVVFGNKGYLIGGGGPESAALRFRDKFPGTIAWFPELQTAEDGTVTVEFDAPDALTRYRILAIASADATRFGGAETSVTIRKPLMLLSGMGMIAHEGDELTARAVLRNASGTPLTIRWQFAAEGAESREPRAGEISLADGASAVIETPVLFSRTGTARLAWTARARTADGEISDALAVEIPVQSPMLTLQEIYFPDLQEGKNDLTRGVNPQVLEGRGEVRLSVANTRLVGLGASAQYLWKYPYGCAEQTASALVPWVTGALHPLLPEFRARAAEAPRTVREGLARLLDMRTGNGGIGFWPGAREASEFATAYAAVVWARALEYDPQTIRIPENILNWLAHSLQREPRDSDPAAWTNRALTLYALALHGRPQPAFMETMLQRAGILPQDARSFLALALSVQREGEGAAERLQAAKGLLKSRTAADAGFDPFANASRSHALRLLALVNITPDSPEIAPAVAELLQARRHEGRWSNTQANAWALLALDRYRQAVELAGTITPPTGARPAALVGSAEIAGESVSISLPGSAQAVEETIACSWPGADNNRSIILDVPTGAKWFAQTQFSITPPLGIQPAQNRGFGITRTYRKVAPDGTISSAENLCVGDRVLVTLELQSAEPGLFVALVDPLPTVLEAINPDFRPERSGILPKDAAVAEADFRETLAGEVRFFVDRLAPGRHLFSYLARVRQAGTAIAPGPRAEEMYRPERFGLGTADTLSTSTN